MKNKIILTLLILWMSLLFTGFLGILITKKINVSYNIEQFFWFLLGCSLVLFFILSIWMTLQWYKQDKNTFSRINFYFFWLLFLGYLILLVTCIFFVYLKSFVPINTYELIWELKNLLGIILYSFVWIGIILIFISIILVFLSLKNENNGSLK